MSLYHLKMRLKNNQLVRSVYDRLIGDKKEKELVAQRQKALRTHGWEMLSTIEKALTEAGARFYLDFGTLLGMVRDGDFIGHDDDMDLAIVIDDRFSWDDLEKALNKYGIRRLKQFSLDGVCTEQTYQMNGLTADFFMHYPANDTQSYSYDYYRKDGYLYNSPYEHHGTKTYAYRVKDITTRNIHGVDLHVPVEAEAYLASLYGAGWRVPDPNWSVEDAPAVEQVEGSLAILSYAE